MKKMMMLFTTALLVLSLAGCTSGQQGAVDEDICPGKQIGDESVPMTKAEGFDPTVDMSFTTKDIEGNIVANEVFAGTERGAWLVFWQTDNDKSAAELARLDALREVAEENGYQIVGVVMDGEKNAEKAKEMSADMGFLNIVWNDEVDKRFSEVGDFFTKEYYDANQEMYEQLTVKPNLGDPVSTYTNSKGQIQSSCILVPISDEKLKAVWKEIDANATYEDLIAKDQADLNK